MDTGDSLSSRENVFRKSIQEKQGVVQPQSWVLEKMEELHNRRR
jgi:hypothetical protein